MGQSDMDMLFPEVKERVRALKSLHLSGELSYSVLQKSLFDLMICDEAGTWWMVGYNTEGWYFYDSATATWRRGCDDA